MRKRHRLRAYPRFCMITKMATTTSAIKVRIICRRARRTIGRESGAADPSLGAPV